VYFHLLHPQDPFPHPSHMTIYSCPISIIIIIIILGVSSTNE
jgi:hypothetical protein